MVFLLLTIQAEDHRRSQREGWYPLKQRLALGANALFCFRFRDFLLPAAPIGIVDNSPDKCNTHVPFRSEAKIRLIVLVELLC
jgi:hypothetical protein